MKTILSFIDWYLPGYKAGGTLKAFANQVSHFENDYKFKIITRNTDYCETEPYNNVDGDNWNNTKKNVDIYYFSAKNTNIRNFKKLVRQTDFDVAYIHGVYSFWYSILPIFLVKRKKTKRIVVVAHGMFGTHAISVKTGKKKLFAFLTKLTGLYRNVYFHAANNEEADDIRSVVGKKTKIIVAEELPMKMKMNEWELRKKECGELKLVSIARISPEKNTKFAIELLKDCKNGNIVYDIYGPVYNEGYWGECKELFDQLPSNVKINYKGSIPGEEVLDALRKYHFMFLPTTGENFGHTILESFMASTPVIISDKTPWQNLEQKGTGWDISLSQKDLFVEKLNTAVELDQKQYDLLSQNALEYAKEFVNDKSLIEQNKRLFEDEK